MDLTKSKVDPYFSLKVTWLKILKIYAYRRMYASMDVSEDSKKNFPHCGLPASTQIFSV